MKIKLLALLLSFSLLLGLSGCTGGDKNQETAPPDAYDNIPTSSIYYSVSEGELTYNPSDPSDMKAHSDTIAIVEVTSIDGGSVKNEITGEPVFTYTYGTVEIKHIVSGENIESENVNFVRGGGLVPFDEWLESQEEASKEKTLRMMGEDAEKIEYVSEYFLEDIPIEAGKTYLAYIDTSGEYSPREDAIQIVGFQGGLREIEFDSDEYYEENYSEIKIMNNYTGEWETLESIL